MAQNSKNTRSTGEVTIAEVAAMAGVSIKTVSRVLNREPNVRQATQERVREAVKKLDYLPNLSARGLAGRRSSVRASTASPLPISPSPSRSRLST